MSESASYAPFWRKSVGKIVWLCRLYAQRIRLFFERRTLRSYRRWWNHLARQNAMEEILTGASNITDFDEAGRQDARSLLDIVGPDKVILDVGCGIGRVELFLAEHCRELHAVDISHVMLAKASDRLPFQNTHLKLGNGRDLSMYKESTFDCVFSFLVLQHLEKEDAFLYLMEFNRVLKDKGKCIVQFPDMMSEPHFNTFLKYVFVEPEFRPAGRVRGYTLEEIRFTMEKAGFDIEEIRRSGADFRVISSKTGRRS